MPSPNRCDVANVSPTSNPVIGPRRAERGERTIVVQAGVTTPFGATSTALEIVDGVRLEGRRAIVTGASSGIGVETARALARAGAEVTLAVRDMTGGRASARDISETTGNRAVHVRFLELSDRASITDFTEAWSGPLHILVNNAGVMACPETRTVEGWEYQFAVNHLGHFLLARGLHRHLAGSDGARVVSVSSVGHVNGDIAFDDLHFIRRSYDPFAAYAQSKTANALFAVGASSRWGNHGIATNALNPGRILTTKLIRHIGDVTAGPAQFGPRSTDVSYKDAEQGAATSTLLAASPLVEGTTGRYFEDCQEAPPHVPGILRGVAPWALDPERAERLWTESLKLLGFPEKD